MVLLGRSRFEQGWFWSSRQVSAQGQGERRLRGRGGRVQAESACSRIESRARGLVVVHVSLVGRAWCRIVWVARSAKVWNVGHVGRFQVPSGTKRGHHCHSLQILHVRQQNWGSRVRCANKSNILILHSDQVSECWSQQDSRVLLFQQSSFTVYSQHWNKCQQLPYSYIPITLKPPHSPTVEKMTWTCNTSYLSPYAVEFQQDVFCTCLLGVLLVWPIATVWSPINISLS